MAETFQLLEHSDLGAMRRGVYITPEMLAKIGGKDAVRDLFRQTHNGSDPIQIDDSLGDHVLIETGVAGDATFETEFTSLLRQALAQE